MNIIFFFLFIINNISVFNNITLYIYINKNNLKKQIKFKYKI